MVCTYKIQEYYAIILADYDDQCRSQVMLDSPTRICLCTAYWLFYCSNRQE